MTNIDWKNIQFTMLGIPLKGIEYGNVRRSFKLPVKTARILNARRKAGLKRCAGTYPLMAKNKPNKHTLN